MSSLEFPYTRATYRRVVWSWTWPLANMPDVRRLYTSLALHMLEELMLRGGRLRLRYWKTYRMARFWLGDREASEILERLVKGGLIRLEGDRAVLTRPFEVKRTLGAVLRAAHSLLTSKEA